MMLLIQNYICSYLISAVDCIYWTTRGYLTRKYANSQIANSRTGQLADWTSHRLDNSQISPATLRA